MTTPKGWQCPHAEKLCLTCRRDILTPREAKRLTAERLAEYERIATGSVCVQPGELLDHIAAIEAELVEMADRHKTADEQWGRCSEALKDSEAENARLLERVKELETALERMGVYDAS